MKFTWRAKVDDFTILQQNEEIGETQHIRWQIAWESLPHAVKSRSIYQLDVTFNHDSSLPTSAWYTHIVHNKQSFVAFWVLMLVVDNNEVHLTTEKFVQCWKSLRKKQTRWKLLESTWPSSYVMMITSYAHNINRFITIFLKWRSWMD